MQIGSLTKQEKYFRQNTRSQHMEIVKMLLDKWLWLAIAMTAGMIFGHCYLLYAPKLYTATALLKFDDKKSEISELINVRNFYDRTNKVESEKSIIRSRTVLMRALQSLDYEVSFYPVKGINKQETYPSNPFKIKILRKRRLQHYDNFIISALDSVRYQLCYTYRNSRICKVHNFNSVVTLEGMQFLIAKARNRLHRLEAYTIQFNDTTELIARVNRSLKLDASQNINLLNLQFSDPNPRFAADMLNAILKEYLTFDRVQRSATASQTSTFINDLLRTMADTVDQSGQEVQKFKQVNQSIITTDNLNLITGFLSTLQGEKHNLELDQLLMTNLEKSIYTPNPNPHALNYQGVANDQLNHLFEKENDAIAARKRALYTYTESSEIVKRLDKELADLRSNIKDKLFKQKESNKSKNVFLVRQIDSLKTKLSKVPRAERELSKLEATSNVNQKVYSYLAEKKLEAEIAKAAVTSGATVVDDAIDPEEAVSPIPVNIYAISALLSLLIAIVIICSVRIFNPYIYNKESIEQFSQIPIIGIVRKCDNDVVKRHKAIEEKPRSLFAESIRSVRSNLSFFASERNSKIICLTSEISGEGKSFLSTNLAIALTLTEKKVLLIAGDLRRSKLHEDFGLSNTNGLSRYLSGQTDLESTLMQTEIDYLTVIPSGPTPPNPSELLHSSKMCELISELRSDFDLIIIDSAPVGLVTDAKPLMKMSDLTLFILRSGISKLHFAETPDLLNYELGLSHVAIILNAYEEKSFYKSYERRNFTQPHAHYYHPNQGSNYYQTYFKL